MSNYNFKLDLSKLSGFGKATLTGKSGQPKRCVIIPIDENHIFEGKNGIYLDLVCIENTNSQYGDTHFVTRSKTKDEQAQEKLSGERMRLPILGNLKPFGGTTVEGDEYSVAQQATAQAPKVAPAPQPVANQMPSEEDNDDQLPF